MTRSLRKSAIFTVRLTLDQMKALKRVAREQRKKPSDLVRDAMLREIAEKPVEKVA